MIKPTGFILTCDGSPDCTEQMQGPTKRHLMQEAREHGWTYDQSQWRHYCLEHTISEQCVKCQRYMYKQRRFARQFPVNWVQESRLRRETDDPICHACAKSAGSGSLAEQTTALMRAERQYLGTHPKMKQFVEETDEEERKRRARKIAPRDLWSTLAL